jgi:hypothetical protein
MLRRWGRPQKDEKIGRWAQSNPVKNKLQQQRFVFFVDGSKHVKILLPQGTQAIAAQHGWLFAQI